MFEIAESEWDARERRGGWWGEGSANGRNDSREGAACRNREHEG